MGLIGCGDFKIVQGPGHFALKKSKKRKRSFKKLAVKVFVVSSADGTIISANIFKAEEDDTILLKQTSIFKRYRKLSLPWFTRTVAGKKIRVPGHFGFDDQEDRSDYIAKKCPYFLSSYGKISGKARMANSYHRGLAVVLNKWQNSTVENTFMTIGRNYNFIRQLPQRMQSFAHIKTAILTCFKLYNVCERGTDGRR